MDKVTVKISQMFLNRIKADLRRQHEHAFERLGFALGTLVQIRPNVYQIIINEYIPIEDKHYVRDETVGAKINAHAISAAYKEAFSKKKGLFHIHLHDYGQDYPRFSKTDMAGIPGIVTSAQSILPDQIHGMLVFTGNLANGKVLLPSQRSLTSVSKICIIGSPVHLSFPKQPLKWNEDPRYARQSFLGEVAEDLFSRINAGVVGLGGGGSHIVQQLAHIGIKNYTLSDPQTIDQDTNLNRLVGATLDDARSERLKYDIAKRVINGLHEDAEVCGSPSKWQEIMDQFKACDVIFGCLDTFAARRDLEAFCRRYLIPYIDIGMDIAKSVGGHIMFGQVQTSLPERPCLICNGYLSEGNLAKEAGNYGVEDPHPQVVWANGVLASTAVGVMVELFTCWTGKAPQNYYLSYEGHLHRIKEHIKMKHPQLGCDHYPVSESGAVNYN